MLKEPFLRALRCCDHKEYMCASTSLLSRLKLWICYVVEVLNLLKKYSDKIMSNISVTIT